MWALKYTCKHGVGAHLSCDMQEELRKRGYVVFKPFWRSYRDRVIDRWYFFRKEMGLPRWQAFLYSI